MRKLDFFLIPAISLVTVCALLGGSEIIARIRFEESGYESCGRPDPLYSGRMASSCTSRVKSAEGPWVEYKYNACGYRTMEACGARPAGTLRITLLGASTAMGYKVPYEEAFAPRAASTLTQACARPVEIQNLGLPGYKMIDHYLRLDEALALKPDVVMLVLSPYELVDVTNPKWLASRKSPDTLREMKTAARAAPKAAAEESLLARITDVAALFSQLSTKSRALLAAQHYLYQDSARFVSLFLLHGDKADYLRPPFSPLWEQRFTDLRLMLREMNDKAKAAGVPFVLLFGPQRVQAASLDPRNRPAGVNPQAIDQRILEIARGSEVVLIDLLDAMGDTPHPEQLYYPVDGHMTGTGHSVIARVMARQLIDKQVGPFMACH